MIIKIEISRNPTAEAICYSLDNWPQHWTPHENGSYIDHINGIRLDAWLGEVRIILPSFRNFGIFENRRLLKSINKWKDNLILKTLQETKTS